MPMQQLILNLISLLDFKEVEGIHSRTDFDLHSIKNFLGKKCNILTVKRMRDYVPYVIETSIGLDRMFLLVLSNAFTKKMAPDANGN